MKQRFRRVCDVLSCREDGRIVGTMMAPKMKMMDPASMSAERYEQPSVRNSVNDYAAPGSGDESSNLNVEMSSSMHRDKNNNNNSKDEESVENAETENNNEKTKDSCDESKVKATTSKRPHSPTVMIPFAIAKLYRLPLTASPSLVGGPKKKGKGRGRRLRSDPPENVSTSPLLSADASADDDSSAAPIEDGGSPPSNDSSITQFVIPNEEYSPTQLRTLVEAILPMNGATIVKQPSRALQGDKEDRYGIIGSDGTLKRILFVDQKGKVFDVLHPYSICH
jgi:hypothetical protein